MKVKAGNTQLQFSVPMSREQAERLVREAPDKVVVLLVMLTAKLAAQSGPVPGTPSGMLAPYQKPAKKKRHKKRGGKPGHCGSNRQTPPEITREEELPPLERCPECGGAVGKVLERRFRIIEDIEETSPEVTRHSIPRQWCPKCAKIVEPRVADAMPGAKLGHRVIVLAAWLHYGLGMTLSHVIELLNCHLYFKLSKGGLIAAWYKLGEVLLAWYEQISDEIKQNGVLHADETGWRQDGKTHWLWCFTGDEATFYMIDRSRGSPALLKFFTEEYNGTLITDFWGAYNSVACASRQTCLVHLLRELEKTDDVDGSALWRGFSRKLKRLIGDAIRLSARRGEYEKAAFGSRRRRLDERLDGLLAEQPGNQNVIRLQKRLRRHSEHLFTFVDHPEVPFENNHAEREVRPAVIMRKNSYCNRSERGSQTQAILMSVYRTLKRRDHDPLETIVSALKQYIATGQLPPLPPMPSSDR